MWGIKCQGVFIPNGLLTNIYITSVAQNDKCVINITGLEAELQRLLIPHRLTNGALPVLYADDIYDPSTVVSKSNGVKNILNLRMNSARVDIEHQFGLTASLFRRLSVKHTWKIIQMGGHVTDHLFSIFYGKLLHLCARK